MTFNIHERLVKKIRDSRGGTHLFGQVWPAADLGYVSDVRTHPDSFEDPLIGVAQKRLGPVNWEELPPAAFLAIQLDGDDLKPSMRKGFLSQPVSVQIVTEQEIYERCSGLIDWKALEAAGPVVTVIGLGMGARIAELLVTAGVKSLVLVDFDAVSPFVRNGLPIGHTGAMKTWAVRNKLLSHNPGLTIETLNADITTISPRELDRILRVGLVIAATDNVAAQAVINERAWTLGTPTVFCAYYADGNCGELLWMSKRHGTGCYACAFESRLVAPPRPAEALAALAVDIDLVANHAAQYGLALLGQSRRQHLIEEAGKNVVFLSTGLDPRTRTSLFGSSFEVMSASAEKGCSVCSKS